jgi:hypothetical protein
MEPEDQAAMTNVNWYPLGFGLLAVAGAASAFGPAFEGTRWIIAVVVAIVVSGAIMAWSVATRTGVFQTILISAGAVLLTTVATVLYNTLGDSITATLQEFFDGLTSGWNDSLQEDLPLVRPTLPLVWVTVMVWLTAAIVARAAAAGRTSFAVFIAPCVLLALATAVTVPSGPPSGLSVAVVAVGLLGVLATTSARDIEWSWNQIRAVALVVGLAVVAGLFAMGASDGDDSGAFDPRSARSENAIEEEVPDLLAQLSELTSEEAVPAATVRVIEGARPTRLRLAVYDEYDGERWRITTAFREILQFTPPAIQPPGDPSTVRVQLIDSPGPWLPVLDRVTAIRPAVRGWDEESETALAETLLTTVTGTVVTQANLSGVAAAATDIDPRYLALPASTPAAILDFATAAVADQPDARSAVGALRTAVLELGRDDSVPTGHSLGRLAADVEAMAPMAAEQLVALHAVLVRAVGIPSRVVVGYAIDDDESVLTSDLTAWTEVAFAGVGWVPFNPVPTEQVPQEGAEGDVTASTTTLPGQAVTQARVVPRELEPGERTPEDFRDSGQARFGWIHVGLLVAVLIVILIMSIVIARAVRRRNRRRATSAPWSIAGAWGELLDRLRENSGPAPLNRTVEEAIDQAEDMAPSANASLRDFTRLVNVTLYSDTPPSWDDAEVAWELLRDIESKLKEAQGRSVSMRAHLDPRSLRFPTPRPAPHRGRRPHPSRAIRTDHPRVQR